MALIEARAISKIYDTDGARVTVLRGVDLAIAAGEFCTIFGASGSGKSTLLHVLGGLDRPTQGTVHFRGGSLYAMDDRGLAAFRNREVGFIFQFYHLLPELSALENVMLPCLIGGVSRGTARRKAEELLAGVGLADRGRHSPRELSGGEQQRVAIARALVQSPALLLADEPTGNLDEAAGTHVMDLLQSMVAARRMTAIMVTHNPELIRTAPRKYELRGGTLHAFA
ncbi:MAG: ABC transporter ATP-binding protein [Deltaproteobacteria bacterium]|nr:ABC transporter ATP-binding protein [Deltaproteobacteria bacterium]